MTKTQRAALRDKAQSDRKVRQEGGKQKPTEAFVAKRTASGKK